MFPKSTDVGRWFGVKEVCLHMCMCRVHVCVLVNELLYHLDSFVEQSAAAKTGKI